MNFKKINIKCNTIKCKVGLAFCIILFIFIGSFVYNKHSLNKMIAETKLLNIADRMVHSVLQIKRHEKNFTLRGKMEWAELVKSYLSRLVSDAEIYRKATYRTEDIGMIEKLSQQCKAYGRDFDDYVETFKNKAMKPERRSLISAQRKALVLTEKLRAEAGFSVKRYENTIIKGELFILILSIAIGLTIFLLICRDVINPIRRLHRLSLAIAKNGVADSRQIGLADKLLKNVNSNDEVGDLARGYREMVVKLHNSYLGLQQKLGEVETLHKLKDQFTSTVSHELRTPLTAIKEGIDLVLDGSTGEITKEQEEFLAIAKRNVDRLTRLINYVLDFSKLRSKMVTFKKEMASINEIIESILSIYRLLTEKKGLCLIAKLEATKGLMMSLDSDRINQVLTNLIDNAVKFTDKGKITVFTTKDESTNFVEVCVKDTGIGIEKDDIAEIFKPFVQLGEKKTRTTGGTGLGLMICKEIIEQLGGRIWLNSKFGKGSRFCFVLPIAERRMP